MSRKKIILLVILLITAGGAWVAFREYSRTNEDLADVKPDYILSAERLVGEYEANEPDATGKYNGKIVEVIGRVKNIEKDERNYVTIILGDTASMSSVRCSVDTLHTGDAAGLSVGSSVTVRGACTGFNRDQMGLGSDAILNRCTVINKKE